MAKAFAAAIVVMVGMLTMTACSSDANDTSDSATTAPAASSGPKIDVALSDFMLMPHSLTATAGAVTFFVHNDGKSPHNFGVKGPGDKMLGITKNLNPGESADLTVTLTAGDFTTYCGLPGHESLGMKGDLKVT